MLINKLLAQNKKTPIRSFIFLMDLHKSTYEKRVAWTVTSIIHNELHLKIKAHGPHCLIKDEYRSKHTSAQDYDYANVWMKKTR